MPVKLCSSPKCPDLATYRGKCQRHSRQRERQRKRVGQAIYRTQRWQATRKAALARQPLCPCGEVAVDVHHLKDIADGGDVWDLDNLQGLCKSCHGRINRQRQLD